MSTPLVCWHFSHVPTVRPRNTGTPSIITTIWKIYPAYPATPPPPQRPCSAVMMVRASVSGRVVSAIVVRVTWGRGWVADEWWEGGARGLVRTVSNISSLQGWGWGARTYQSQSIYTRYCFGYIDINLHCY